MLAWAIVLVAFTIVAAGMISVAMRPITVTAARTWGRYAHTNDRRPRQSLASRKTRYVVA